AAEILKLDACPILALEEQGEAFDGLSLVLRVADQPGIVGGSAAGHDDVVGEYSCLGVMLRYDPQRKKRDIGRSFLLFPQRQDEPPAAPAQIAIKEGPGEEVLCVGITQIDPIPLTSNIFQIGKTFNDVYTHTSPVRGVSVTFIAG